MTTVAAAGMTRHGPDHGPALHHAVAVAVAAEGDTDHGPALPHAGTASAMTVVAVVTESAMSAAMGALKKGRGE